MMRRFALTLLISVLAPNLLHGGPGRDSLFLDGSWESTLGTCVLPGTTDENRLGGGNASTPVTSGLTRLYPFEGKVTYTRTVEIPVSFSGKRLSLVLERTKPSTLSIDGVEAGSDSSLLVPHVYELPPLQPGLHEISLTVDNSPAAVPEQVWSSHAWNNATQTNWNGVIGRMFIEAVDSVFISSMDIFPDVKKGIALVRTEIVSDRDCSANLSIRAVPEPSDADVPEGKVPASSMPSRVSCSIDLSKGRNVHSFTLDMGDDPLLWSEFHPHLYRFDAVMETVECKDSLSVYSGMRDFSTDGTSFANNGCKVFLRGKHDACVFPLTGYPPMDTEAWRELFSRAREYGINHYRFHSWTPPEAAFEAADREGVYLQPELPLWGAVERADSSLDIFVRREAARILAEYGNHPSFVMFSLGNELHGDTGLMAEWTEEFRKSDGRHLYCFGSNNNLGWEGPQDGEDYFVACRVGWGEGYSSHTRTTFAFVDADKGGILNNTRPGTRGDYSGAISASPVPVVSHESCQFQIYPDYSETDKYTGVLYPYNLEIFRQRLHDNGMGDRAEDFSKASGRFAVECFKADFEYALRTPGFGGFQVLDLQDYPGQGTALVGVLDAFMDSKGVVTPEEFRHFCSPVVLLASFDGYCLTRRDTVDVDLLVSNYTEEEFRETLLWRLSVTDARGLSGKGVRFPPELSGSVPVSVANGEVSHSGNITVPLEEYLGKTPDDMAFCLSLELSAGEYSNLYKFWVYPDNTAGDRLPRGLVTADTADDRLRQMLEDGRTVLLFPSHGDIVDNSVGGLFTPDFWNWSMFRRISERAGKEISPGTLSVINDPEHPAFGLFPNEGHSDWQWWSISLHSRPLIMDSLDGYTPVLQVIDNVERCHKLGIVAEFAVGNGRLLICTTDPDAVSDTPEGAAFIASLASYASSDNFSPSYRLDWNDLLQLLYGKTGDNEVTDGVENPTAYSDYPGAD